MSKLGNLGARLHRGEIGYDFIGNRKIWYGISILITITAIVGLAVRGLNMGIEFQGGAVFTTPRRPASRSPRPRTYAEEASGHDAIVQKLGNGSLRIQIAGIDTDAVRPDQDGARQGPQGRPGDDQRRPGRPQLGRADRQQGLAGPRRSSWSSS